MNTMYGVPPRGHLQGQTRDNSNTRFFTLKETHIHVEGARKLMKPKHIFASPGKTEL